MSCCEAERVILGELAPPRRRSMGEFMRPMGVVVASALMVKQRTSIVMAAIASAPCPMADDADLRVVLAMLIFLPVAATKMAGNRFRDRKTWSRGLTKGGTDGALRFLQKLEGPKMDSNPPPTGKNSSASTKLRSKKYAPFDDRLDARSGPVQTPFEKRRMAGRPNFNSTGGLRSTYGVGAYQASSRNNAAVRPLGKADAPR
jgi:hypothetical protein